MMRRWLPRFEIGPWGGATLTNPDGRDEKVRGFCVCVQWFGLMIEIGMGRVETLK